MFSHLCGGLLKLCWYNNWVLGHLLDQGLTSSVPEFGWSHGDSKLITFHNDGIPCAHENIQNFRNVFIPLPRTTSQHSLIVDVYREFLGLVFGLICNAFVETCTPFYIMSKLNLTQTDSCDVLVTAQDNQSKQYCMQKVELNLEGLGQGSEYLSK